MADLRQEAKGGDVMEASRVVVSRKRRVAHRVFELYLVRLCFQPRLLIRVFISAFQIVTLRSNLALIF